MLLEYQPLIGNFLDGLTVSRSQEVRVEPTTLFVAQSATTPILPEHPDLIPTGKVSEMAPPINPYELMGKKSKGKRKTKQDAQAKKPKRVVFEVIAPKQAIQNANLGSAAREEQTQPPQVMEIDEPEEVAEPAPRAKKARTKGE